MKKNYSLRIFNLLAKRVYKLSKKRKLGWKWRDAQKWTSANLFKLYKGKPISKIRVTQVDSVIISILDGGQTPTGLPTPTPKPTVCFDPFNIPTKDLKDINWWMLSDQVNFFDDNLNMRVAIGSIIDTGVVKKFELPNLNQTVEDMRKAGFGSDENIIFKILVAPNKSDDGKPCSYYVLATLVGSDIDTETATEEVMKVVTEEDLPIELREEREDFEEWGREYYKSDNPEDGMASKVNIDENESVTTKLYIEKEIYIIIQRYKVTPPPAPR